MTQKQYIFVNGNFYKVTNTFVKNVYHWGRFGDVVSLTTCIIAPPLWLRGWAVEGCRMQALGPSCPFSPTLPSLMIAPVVVKCLHAHLLSCSPLIAWTVSDHVFFYLYPYLDYIPSLLSLKKCNPFFYIVCLDDRRQFSFHLDRT